ncbi:MAG TPA: hypothetical protein VKM55_06530 [Candidatus Lokiarchaeia archaeon]|nr:hypothetical protein [Candidatus Lokiarchaeia archaeon]
MTRKAWFFSAALIILSVFSSTLPHENSGKRDLSQCCKLMPWVMKWYYDHASSTDYFVAALSGKGYLTFQ